MTCHDAVGVARKHAFKTRRQDTMPKEMDWAGILP